MTFVQGFVLIAVIRVELVEAHTGRVKRSEGERFWSQGEAYQPRLQPRNVAGSPVSSWYAEDPKYAMS